MTLLDADSIRDAIERAVRGGARVIVAGGGGTLGTVASMLVDSEVALGGLPPGMVNPFAKDRRIPLDLTGAVRMTVAGDVECVDVGDVNGRIFINHSNHWICPNFGRMREQQRERLGTS